MYYSVKYLNRHPTDFDYSLEQWADIVYICREIEKHNADTSKTIIEALIGSRI